MKKILFVLCAAAATLVACNKAEVITQLDNSRVVKFSVSNLYSFETKAAGDAIGTDNTNNKVAVYAGTPIASTWSSPVLGRYDVGAITSNAGELSGESLLWGVGQGNTDSNFFAFYPVAADGTLTWTHDTGSAESDLYTSYTIEGVSFGINTLVAKVAAHPGSGETPTPVELSFAHPFTLLEYDITNSTDDAIQKVEIWGFNKTGKIGFTSGTVDEVSDLVAVGQKMEMLKVDGTGAAGGAVTKYQMPIMPAASSITPSILITMWSGKTYQFSLSSASTFDAGKHYKAAITIDAVHTTTTSSRTSTFSFSVPANWGESVDKTVGSATAAGESKWWYLEGTIGNNGTNNWVNHLPLKCVGENLWEITGFKYYDNVGDNPGIKFRYVADPATDDWSVNYGVQDGVGNKMSLNLSSSTTTYGGTFDLNLDQKALMLGSSGTYSLSWNSSTHTITSATRTGD